MKTAYVNHTDKVDFHEGTAWHLYENRLAAMHYYDVPVSTDPSSLNEDGNGRDTLENFIDYVDDGAILGVRNNRHPKLQGGLVVGSAGQVRDVTRPDHAMRIIVSRSANPDDWQCNCDGVCTADCSVIGSIPVEPRADEQQVMKAARKHSPEAHEVLQGLAQLDGGTAEEVTVLGDTTLTLNDDNQASEVSVLKAIKLNPEDSHWVWYRDFPAFSTLQHRGTTNGWNKGSEQLLAAYEGVENLADVSQFDVDVDVTVELLSAGQLETLCSEYLRSVEDEHGYEDYFHEYPVGGSLTAVDIIARDGATGRRVISQVTFDGGKPSKIRALASYASTIHEDADLWYFGRKVSENDIPVDVEEEIIVKPIDEVFNEMEGTTIREAILSVPTSRATPDGGGG